MVSDVLPRSPFQLGVDADCDVSPAHQSVHLRRHRRHRLDTPPPILPNLTSSSSPSSASTPTPPPPYSSSSRSSSASRPPREVSSRYRSPLPPPPPPQPSSDAAPLRCRSPALPSSSRRFSSPSADRGGGDSPLAKRSASAERRRAPASDTIRQQHRGMRSDLWPPSSRNLSLMQFAEPCTPPATANTAADGGGGSIPCSDQTLKPSVNAPQRLPSPDRRKATHERSKGSMTLLQRQQQRNPADQAENAKPQPPSSSSAQKLEAAPLVVRHRWPSSLKLYGSTAVSKSMDLGNGAAAPPPDRPPSRSSSRSSVNLLQSRPTSFSSQVIPARVFSHTINDGPASAALRAAARKLSLESKLRHRPGVGVGRESPSATCQRRATPQKSTEATARLQDFGGAALDLARQSGEASPEYGSNSTVGGSGSPRELGMMLWKSSSDSYGRSRTPSDNVSRQRASELCSGVVLAGMRLPPSRMQKMGVAEAWLPYPAAVLPGYGRYGGGVYHLNLSSPAAKLPSSPLRSRGAAATATVALSGASASPTTVALHYGVDFRRTKKGLSMVESVYLHRILHNRLLQWRFANARAEYGNAAQRHAGEKQLFSVWAKTAEIRKSVTTKRLKLQQARQAHKINSILRSQGCKLEYWWGTLQQEHSSALSGAVEALEAAVLRLPVDEGVKAETQAVKEAMASAVEVVKAVEISVNQLLPKMEKTNMLISELAQIADQERTLLEECGDVLSIVSSLEVEESSLRMQLLQFEQEKARVLGLLMMDDTGGGGPL